MSYGMITLEHFDGEQWIKVSEWTYEHFAWDSIGGDKENYRTVDEDGNVITDNTFWGYK